MPRTLKGNEEESLMPKNTIGVVKKMYMEVENAWNDNKRIVSAQGGTRCFGKGTMIRMADGRCKAVELIEVGDRLMNIDGNGYVTVKSTHSDIGELYRVKCKRGGGCYVVNGNHILSMVKRNDDSAKAIAERDFVNISVDDFMKLTGKKPGLFSIPKFSGIIQLEEKKLPIDPYYLGVWLGDGTALRWNDITNSDKEILDWFDNFAKSLGSKTVTHDRIMHRIVITENGKKNKALYGPTREMRERFRSLNLIGNKHVPGIYIYNSYENRMKLMAGLIDTDGCKTRRNTLEFTSTKIQLAEAMLELCRLNGFFTNGIRHKIAKMKRSDGSVYECDSYSIEINHKDFNEINKYMLVERKKIIGKKCERDYYRSRIDIESIGRGRYYGFELEEEPYFLTQHIDIQHNSGKTYNIMIWVINRCITNAGTKVGICRKSFPVVYDSVYKDFRDIMTNLGLWSENRMNQTHHEYTFGNGSVVVFFSADQSAKLKGKKNDITWLNEATEMEYMDFQQLSLRTTGSGMVILDYNPDYEDDHWLCNVNQRPDCHFFITTYRENIFLEEAQIREIEMLKNTNPTLWEQYGNGKRCKIQGRIFPIVDHADNFPRNCHHKYVGVDFGFANDPTAVVRVAITKEAIYIEQLCYRKKMLSEDVAEVLNQPSVKHTEIIADSADPQYIAECEKYMGGKKIIPVNKGGRYAAKVIQSSLAFMMGKKIVVVGNSPDVDKELQHYCFKLDKKGEPTNEPIDKFNHAIDAIRYVVIMRGMKHKGGVVKVEYIS